MAEWLGNGLQNHVQRFESARHLQKRFKKLKRFFYGKELVTKILFYGYLGETQNGFIANYEYKII